MMCTERDLEAEQDLEARQDSKSMKQTKLHAHEANQDANTVIDTNKTLFRSHTGYHSSTLNRPED